MHGAIDTKSEKTDVYRFKAVCGHCGGTFWARSDRARWCSQACKQRSYRGRKARKSAILPAAVQSH